MQRNKLCLAASLCAALGMGASAAHATAVFSENFDSGSATFTTDDPYWTDPAEDNGYIVKSTAGIGTFGPNQIGHDASGSGYFLFEGTTDDRTDPSHSEFYISPEFAVAADTTYTVSFELTNADPTNVASVQPEIDGVLLGSPVSAVGAYYLGQGWQIFSFTWNSGSDVTASLILNDYTVTGYGNDFGIDNILVQPANPAVPEPTSLLLLATGLAGLRWSRRRRGTGCAAGSI